jgi:hypothetical protein
MEKLYRNDYETGMCYCKMRDLNQEINRIPEPTGIIEWKDDWVRMQDVNATIMCIRADCFDLQPESIYDQ